MQPWLDDTEDTGLPAEGPVAPNPSFDTGLQAAPAQAGMDPKVKQFMMDKYFAATDKQGVNDARDKQQQMNMIAGLGDLGTALIAPDRRAQTFVKGWNETGPAQTTKPYEQKGSLFDPLRQAGAMGVQRAQNDRASNIQDFEGENKLNNQARQQGREDVQDAQAVKDNQFKGEQQGQTRSDWDVKNKANNPSSPAADQSRLLLQSTLVQKSKAAREAGDSQAADQLMDQAKSAGQGMSATEIIGLHNQIKDLSYDDILKTKNQKANLEATQAYRTTLNDQHRDKESRTAATKLAGDLQSNRGDKGAQMASANVLQADNALKLISLYPDLNKMPQQQLAQLNSEIAKIATGGVASEHAMGEMSADNLQARAAKWTSFMSSNPTPAQQAGFIKENMKYLQDLRENSASYLKNRRGALIQGNKSINEDDRADLYKQYDIDPSGAASTESAKPQPSAPGRKVVGGFDALPD